MLSLEIRDASWCCELDLRIRGEVTGEPAHADLDFTVALTDPCESTELVADPNWQYSL